MDYFLWTVKRFYEPRKLPGTEVIAREDRFLNLLWPQIGEIHDLDFGPNEHGTFFTAKQPLTLDARFGEAKGKKKKPRV